MSNNDPNINPSSPPRPSPPDFGLPPLGQFRHPLHRPGYSRLESDDGALERVGSGEVQDAGLGLTYKRVDGATNVDVGGKGATRIPADSEPGEGPQSSATHHKGIARKQATVTQPDWSPAGIDDSPTSVKASLHALSPQLSGPSYPSEFEPVYESQDAGRAKFGSHLRQPSMVSFHDRSLTSDRYDDTDPLAANAADQATSIRSRRSMYDEPFDPRDGCPAMVNFEHSRLNWYGITIFTLSIFSTVFSGIYSIVAAIGPRYGRTIGTNTKLTASTASILTTLFAKLIELSFVTVFIAFVGQALSRRSFMQRHNGVSLAELSMRSWIMQPGSLISHPQSLRYAGATLLGACCLTAALVALLYTTAAEALVSPQLKFSSWKDHLMQGPVLTAFGNVYFLKTTCQTPLRDAQDDGGPLTYGGTCNDILLAGDSYHNYLKFLEAWKTIVAAGNGTTDMSLRPPGYALLYDNTTITGAWVNRVDVSKASESLKRVINNVSLAMPHAGVSLAAYDSKNGILQPSQLDGLGIYNIRASVPSPMVNVMCANVEEHEIENIVYTNTSSGKNANFNISQWPGGADWSDLNGFKIKTPLDDLFGWGKEKDQFPPMFYKAPAPFNTILNGTGNYGQNALHLLGRGGPLQNNQLILCSLKATQHLHCSTNFTATASGASMHANCDDPNDGLSFFKRLNNDSFPETVNLDWVDLADEWGTSISLNDGISDANASNARLLTELILTGNSLNPSLPSPAEALAVLAGSTLLHGSLHAPYVPFWNYTPGATVETPQYQFFNASIRAQEYASGGVQRYQYAFYPVLFAVFIINVLLLAYFIAHKGMVTDYCEPANLFVLAVNSPPSQLVAGSCGGGPEGEQYRVNWRIRNENEHLYVTSELPGGWRKKERAVAAATGYEMALRSTQSTPVSRAYSKFSRRTTLL